jgi:hypothetical protein
MADERRMPLESKRKRARLTTAIDGLENTKDASSTSVAKFSREVTAVDATIDDGCVF